MDHARGGGDTGGKRRGLALSDDEQLTRRPRVSSVAGGVDMGMDHDLCDFDLTEADDAHMEAIGFEDQEQQRLLESIWDMEEAEGFHRDLSDGG